MLLPNNTEIDTDALNEKLASIATHRRRASPLFASRDTGQPSSVNGGLPSLASLPVQGARIRDLLKRIPVAGTLLVSAYRHGRAMVAPGLSLKQRARLVPFVGSLAVWAYSIVRLNAVRHRIALDMDHLRFLNDALDASTRHALGAIDARFGKLDASLDKLESSVDKMHESIAKIDGRIAELDDRLGNTDARLAIVDASLESVTARLDVIDTIDIGARLATFDALDIGARLLRLDQLTSAAETGNIERDNRIAGMTREVRGLRVSLPVATDPVDGKIDAVAAVPRAVPEPLQAVATDSFYIDFEDRFRGTRDDIFSRLEVYLPCLERFVGDGDARAVDVGCGRGEWLELMARQGIKATGIDLNQAMVTACHELGLDAQCMDAIAYLRQQPEGSLAVITGFHIIEHLPFEVLLSLFDAALRALRPDGLVIFETPNPENLMVGACNFYYDPTHLNPIVPVVAEFMARQRGFAHAEILRLHPFPESHRLAEDSETARRVNDALYGPQDYAVLAWKTHAN